ncbi:hypothetical protein LINPERHAP1_LOCUS3836, partial [Linum perenne]
MPPSAATMLSLPENVPHSFRKAINPLSDILTIDVGGQIFRRQNKPYPSPAPTRSSPTSAIPITSALASSTGIRSSSPSFFPFSEPGIFRRRRRPSTSRIWSRSPGKQGIMSWILAGFLPQSNSPGIHLSGGIYSFNRKTW